MKPIKISVLIEQLGKFNPDNYLIIEAVNAPPWIVEYAFREVVPESDEDE